jgi:hypothetical protein
MEWTILKVESKYFILTTKATALIRTVAFLRCSKKMNQTILLLAQIISNRRDYSYSFDVWSI